MWKSEPLFRELMYDRRFAEWTGQLLDAPQVVALQNSVLVKPPGEIAELEWHQDWTNWPLSPTEALSFWIALDDVTMEKGSMQFAEGTHTLGRFLGPILESGLDAETVECLKTEHGLASLPDPGALGLRLRDVEIQAGECSIHHGLTWHRSGSNATGEPRRAITQRYANGACAYTGFTPSAMLLAWIDPGGSADDVGRPIAELDVYPVIDIVRTSPGHERGP
jgi:ectoine hydroxylase-related dioxygenase (phytanoyl-CoA dioxygenase family)